MNTFVATGHTPAKRMQSKNFLSPVPDLVAKIQVHQFIYFKIVAWKVLPFAIDSKFSALDTNFQEKYIFYLKLF